jgi:hypothetical protein
MLNMKPIFIFPSTLLALALAVPVTGMGAGAVAPPYVAGGIGESDLQHIRSLGSEYPLHLTFSEGKRSEFVANVDVSIKDQNGVQVLSLANTGPLLYVRLPRGHYEVVALYHGDQKTRHVTLSSGRPQSVFFHWME